MSPTYLIAQTTEIANRDGQPATADMEAAGASWTDLSLLDWHANGLEARIGLLWLVLFLLAGLLLWFAVPWLRRRLMRQGFRTKSVKLTFKGVEWEIYPDYETRRIAYQAWVEIQTRKVGLLFEEEHDVIVEVYNSWFQLFGILRELCKSVPPDRVMKTEDTRKLIDVLLAALNKGLRPHLTRWQARFRRWYVAEAGKEENAARTPQEIQRTYAEYANLVTDLKAVNREFVKFAQSLLMLTEGGR